MSLREELLGLAPEVPRFRILLPPEWRSFPVTPGLADQLEQRTRPVFARAGRPDLDGIFSSQLHTAMRGLQKAGTKYVFLPSERAEGKDPLPLSMTATFVDAGSGTLDGWVASHLRRGAEMLDDAGRIVHWRHREPTMEGDAHSLQCTYVIPVPGSNRTKALVLAGTTILRVETPDDDDYITAVRSLFDAMASTVTWTVEPAGGQPLLGDEADETADMTGAPS